jgi:ABC-type polysaccharide/polyol phosphate transport system ATPase subunit
LRCLVDFTDAEDQEDPNMLNPIISWSEVKEYIKSQVKKISG